MGSLGKDEGIHVGGKVNHLPITENLNAWEQRSRQDIERGVGRGKVETAALFDKNGKPIDAYVGTEHSVNIDPSKMKTPETAGATFTHVHPNNDFGGSLSLTDLHTFAQTNWGEMRAVSKQGQLYSLKAEPNADREGLRKWVQSKNKMYKKNLSNAYESALKQATTVLKSGPHKGQIKLTTRKNVTDPKTGERKTVTQVTYRKPMTDAQAEKYARTYSVGMLERTYQKNLSKFGFTYKKTKGGK